MNRAQTDEEIYKNQLKNNRQNNEGQIEVRLSKLKKNQKVNVQPQYTKFDILFYNAFKRQKSLIIKEGIYHAVKALIFIVFILLDYSLDTGAKAGIITVAMGIALAVSIFAMFGDILYYCIPLKNTKGMIQISKRLNHSTQQPINTQNISVQDLQKCVSLKMYNQPNETQINQQGLTQQLKDLYQNIVLGQLQETIFQDYGWLKSIFGFSKFICFCSFVFSLIAVSIGEPNVPERVILIVYIVLEGVTKIFIILTIVAIALSPIICCMICMFVICCGQNRQEVVKKLPQSIKATPKDITQAGGDCTICYQSFKVNQDVIKLKCSDKHMFHQFCIGNWVKIKPNCPVCRHPLQDA